MIYDLEKAEIGKCILQSRNLYLEKKRDKFKVSATQLPECLEKCPVNPSMYFYDASILHHLLYSHGYRRKRFQSQGPLLVSDLDDVDRYLNVLGLVTTLQVLAEIALCKGLITALKDPCSSDWAHNVSVEKKNS